MVFQCINIRQVSWEVLKTAAFGLGLQHLPGDLANVNARKTMFDPYTDLIGFWGSSKILPMSKIFLNYLYPNIKNLKIMFIRSDRLETT